MTTFPAALANVSSGPPAGRPPQTVASGPRATRFAVPLALALASILAAGALGRLAADRLGTSLGRSAAAAVASLPWDLARTRSIDAALEPALEVVPESEPALAGTPREAGRRRPDRPRGGRGEPTTPVVVVPAQAVLALANAGARPSAVPAAPSGSRPAGLRLVGVGRLGIGMRDGDVLTRVLGGPAISVGSVVDAVIRARARRLPRISAEFWRGDRRHGLVVEQPYLAALDSRAPPP